MTESGEREEYPISGRTRWLFRITAALLLAGISITLASYIWDEWWINFTGPLTLAAFLLSMSWFGHSARADRGMADSAFRYQVFGLAICLVALGLMSLAEVYLADAYLDRAVLNLTVYPAGLIAFLAGTGYIVGLLPVSKGHFFSKD